MHPSTVSRAVASKYVHTPQGVFELRYFFSEAVQGPSGGSTPLLTLKRMVKKMIDDEDRTKPLTDEHITSMLQTQGDQCHPAHRGEVPGGHENPFHTPASHSQLSGARVPALGKRSKSSFGRTHENHVHGQTSWISSSSTEEELEARFAKIGKLLSGKRECEAHVILSLERHLHHAEATIHYFNQQLVGLGSSSDLFEAIHDAAEKLEKQR